MNIAVLICCFILAATFHQVLYIIIPIVSLFHVSSKKNSRIAWKNPILKLYLTIVIVVFLLILIQSFIDFEVKTYSIKGFGRYVSYFLFAVFIYNCNQRDIVKTFKIIIVYYVLTLPLGVYQVIELGRYQNIHSHANHLAYSLIFCIYFLIFHKPFDKWMRTIFIIVLLISLLLTKSSGGIMVFLTLIGYNVFKSNKISYKKKTLLVISFIIVTLMVLLTSEKVAIQIATFDYLDWDFIKDRVVNFRGGGGYGSLMWRIIYWLRILLSFLSESLPNILFGVGVDSLTSGNMPYAYMRKDPHNDFVKVLVEFGVVGFVWFLALFKNIYDTVNKNFNIIILIVIPMFFGNAIVNFALNMIFILLIFYEYKRYNAEGN